MLCGSWEGEKSSGVALSSVQVASAGYFHDQAEKKWTAVKEPRVHAGQMSRLQHEQTTTTTLLYATVQRGAEKVWQNHKWTLSYSQRCDIIY